MLFDSINVRQLNVGDQQFTIDHASGNGLTNQTLHQLATQKYRRNHPDQSPLCDVYYFLNDTPTSHTQAATLSNQLVRCGLANAVMVYSDFDDRLHGVTVFALARDANVANFLANVATEMSQS